MRALLPILLAASLASCSLLESGDETSTPTATPEPPQADAPATPTTPKIQLDFPAEPGAETPPPVAPRVRTIYRSTWAEKGTVDVLGVDVDRKEAWLVLHEPGRAFAIDHLAVDTGRRLEHHTATSRARLDTPPYDPWLPLDEGQQAADWTRFAGIIHRSGPYSTRLAPPTTQQLTTSPNGEHVAWSQRATARSGLTLRLASRDGARPQAIAPDFAWSDLPAFSPNSDRLAFRACRRHDDLAPALDTCRLLTGPVASPNHVHDDVAGPRELQWSSRGDRLFAVGRAAGRDCLLELPGREEGPARTVHCLERGATLTRAFITSNGLTAVLLATPPSSQASTARWVGLRDGDVLGEHALVAGFQAVTLSPDDTLIIDHFEGGASPTATLHLLDQTGRRGSLTMTSRRPLQGLASTRWIEQEAILVRWSGEDLFELVGVRLEPYVLRTLGDHREADAR